MRTLSPRWLLPDTYRRIGKDRTGADLDEHSLLFQYVTKKGDCCGQIDPFLPRFPPPNRPTAQPWSILLWPETLNAGGSNRAWRTAISRNACALPDFPEFAQAV